MTIGIVIYCDAGARPTNPGFVGWGLHGYKYKLEEPKKGTGLTDQILTNEGYFLKSAFAEVKANNPVVEKVEGEERPSIGTVQQVTPISYVDGFGSLLYTTTNNVGELQAAIETLLWCKNHPEITKINILADSRYVVDGSNEYLAKWKANNWIKQDRTPVANERLWKELDSLLAHYREANIDVTIEWVKAHNGEHGNEIADRHATIAVLKAMRNEHVTSIETSNPEGYWKSNVDKHPFISHKRMYFNTLPNYQIPGQYYLGDHGRDDDMLGKKSSDGAIAFVAIHKPNETLELIRDYQSKIANGSDTLVMARLDYLFNPMNHRDIEKHQHYSMFQKDNYRLDLYALSGEPITRELRPAKLAIRAIESMSDLSQRLDQYLQNDPQYTKSDITDVFFNISEVKKKKDGGIQYKLKDEIIVGMNSIDSNAQYDDNGTIKNKVIPLTFGVDIPGRNSLKHMESIKPKVELITWKESDKSFRYATVISTDTDKGIWAGVYSNLIVIND